MDRTKHINVFYVIIFIGVILSFIQFFYNRSLWIDEAMLALNIINRDFLELLKPLENFQVAPIGFLYVEKIFVLLIGKNDFALRVFPLISFLLSIPLIYSLSYCLTGNRLTALLSTSFFCLTLTLVEYSSEVKQYMTDVLFALLIYYCTLSLKFSTIRSLIIFTFVGCLSVFMSNASVIMLFISGLYILYSEIYKRQNYKLIFVIMSWGFTFLLYYFLFISGHPSRDVQVAAWVGFMPLNPFSCSFWCFVYFAAKSVFYNTLGFGPFWIFPFLFSFGVILQIIKRKNYRQLFLLLGPFACHLLISGFKLYPFHSRLILYLAPLSIIIMTIGLVQLFEFVNSRVIKISVFVLILPILLLFYPFYHHSFPIEKEEIKKSLSYIDKTIEKDQIIYIYYGAIPAFDFYKSTGEIQINNAVIIGNNHRYENEKYDLELLELKGRIWFLFSHVYLMYEIEDHEEKYIIDFLLKNGGELIDIRKFRGSSAYLIDI